MVRVALDSVGKCFGRVVALDGVSLSVNTGELFFLLGPSGCGKTTLLRCVAGFCSPDRGRVLIDGQDVTDLPTHHRETGMVFQNYALWPHMTVADNVAFGLEVRRVPPARKQALVARALHTVKLAELAGRKPNELSGGQQQRVALARALVVEPKCLLLDEPLSNLDAGLRTEMRAEIRAICKAANLTALYVTHDQKEALSTADRIAVMSTGRIEQIGTPTNLYDRPANRFVAGFVGESNFVAGTITATDGDQVRVRTPIGELVSAAAPSELPTGAPVVCSIRPEALRLASSPENRPNTFRGVITDTVYLGESARHRLDVAGQLLDVLEVNPKSVDRRVGSEVSGWIDAGDVVVLTE